MGDFNIPARTPLPTDTKSPDYAEKLAQAQEANANRTLMIQTMMSQQTEEQATRSNMQKSGHDALMAVISNFKS